MIDFRLTPQQEELRQVTREFAAKEVLPVASYYDEKDETPRQVLKKAFEAGLMSTAIPQKYGGKQHGVLDGVIMIEEIAAACPGIATSIFDNTLGMTPLIFCKNEALKEKYLSELAQNFKLICFATSEPTLGSDVSSIRCTAKQDNDGYVLNGTKYWVTNGGLADYMTIFATIDPKSAHKGICAFLIDKNWEGVTVGKHIPKLGQRASNTVGINFNNVRVPNSHVIAPPGEGFVLAMKTFSMTRPAIGAFATGAARSAMEFAIDYVKKRQAFGTKIANFQAIQFKLAEMFQKIETSRLLVWKAAWEADSGLDSNITSSIAKMYSSETSIKVISEALQLMGGYGYTRMFPVEKLFRDSRLFMIYEGTSEIQRLVVSGHVLYGYQPVMPPLEDLPLSREKLLSPEEVESEPTAKTAWRCRICGHVHYGDEPPENCPYCFFPKTAFKKKEI